MRRRALLLVSLATLNFAPLASAENLYRDSSWSHMAADPRPRNIGDLVTIIVYQSTEARQSARSTGGKDREFQGGLVAGGIDESASLSWNGSYSGVGEARRSESFVTQLSAVVTEILPNGDLRIEGRQHLFVNREETTILVRGRVRPSDIGPDNQVLSSRIADAEINYDGRGFVTRNARPGLVHRLFSFLGIGG